MEIRKADLGEIERIVCELWQTLAREMEEFSEYNKLKQDLDLEEVVDHKLEKRDRKNTRILSPRRPKNF